MINKYLFAGLCLLCVLSIRAQNRKDTSFISQFEKQNNLQVNTWLTDVNFGINPRLQNRNFSVELAPNSQGHAGISIGFKLIALFIGGQIPGTQSDLSIYGRTKYYDVLFGYFNRRWGGEIYYRDYDGLYRKANDATGITVRPDARLLNYGLSGYYVFNHKKFSYRSAIAQLELQKKTSGSFVMLINVHHRGLSADSSVIPANIDTVNNFKELQGLTAIQFNSFNIRPGYAHNFVFRKGLWFISPSLFAGAGIGNYLYKNGVGTSSGTNFDVDIHAKLSAGYNHKKLFFNVYIIHDQSINIFTPSLISLQTTSFGFNFGYRLNSFFGVKWL